MDDYIANIMAECDNKLDQLEELVTHSRHALGNLPLNISDRVRMARGLGDALSAVFRARGDVGIGYCENCGRPARFIPDHQLTPPRCFSCSTTA